MKRIITASLAVVLLAAMTCASASEAGTAADPLVTKSYAEGEYASGLVAELTAGINTALQAVYDRALGQASPGSSDTKYTNGREYMALPAGSVLSVFTGGTVVLIGGDMSMSLRSGTVIDASSGKAVSGGADLARNVRYVCVEDTTAVLTAMSDCTIILEGSYRPDGKVDVPARPTFTDVPAWCAEAAEYLAARKIMDGTGAGLFSPNSTTTRGMVMTILARAAGVNTAGSDPWYQIGMEWSVPTISDGTRPTAPVTREEIATMLWRYFGTPACDKAPDFPDVYSVSGYAITAMCWCVDNGIINGNGGLLDPKGPATRAQTAAMVYRALTKFAG